jgi:hypothetical protein
LNKSSLSKKETAEKEQQKNEAERAIRAALPAQPSVRFCQKVVDKGIVTSVAFPVGYFPSCFDNRL